MNQKARRWRDQKEEWWINSRKNRHAIPRYTKSLSRLCPLLGASSILSWESLDRELASAFIRLVTWKKEEKKKEKTRRRILEVKRLLARLLQHWSSGIHPSLGLICRLASSILFIPHCLDLFITFPVFSWHMLALSCQESWWIQGSSRDKLWRRSRQRTSRENHTAAVRLTVLR